MRLHSFSPGHLWRSVWWIGLLLLLGCQGCTAPVLRMPGGQPIETGAFHFRNGGQALYFSFDKSLDDWRLALPGSAVVHPATYLFMVAGSDCTSIAYFLPDYFRGLEGESGPIRVFILHKRFIRERTWGRTFGCSAEFVRADHPERWIGDQVEFIQAQLTLAQEHGSMPQRVAILGISEGGDIVPLLAQQIPQTTHAAILANGGMNPLDAYRLQAHRQGFDAVLPVLDAMLVVPPADIDHTLYAGRSWRYWSELHALRHTDNLLSLQIPVLVAMGEADQAVPVESAWYLYNQFVSHRKTNLTLLTYPGANHALMQQNVSRLPDFWHVFDLWLKK
jgi:esterase/lipase